MLAFLFLVSLYIGSLTISYTYSDCSITMYTVSTLLLTTGGGSADGPLYAGIV